MKEYKIVSIKDDKYVVACSTTINEINYGYLVNLNNNSDVFFAILSSDTEIIKIEDSDMIESLIPLLLKSQNYFNISEG